MTRRPLRAVAALIAIALLGACGDDDDTAATATTAAVAAVAVTTAAPADLALGGDPPLATAATTIVPASPTTPTAPNTSPPAPTTAPPTTVAGPPQTSCESVIHVGDSTSVSLISPSFIADPALRVDAQYRRVGAIYAITEIDGALSTRETLDGQTNAFDRVTAIKAGGYEGCWVFALGGNDTANVSAIDGGPTRLERIETMMSAIGDDPVMWVNVKTLRDSGAYRNDNMLLWNEALLQAQPDHPNMRIFDWATVVQDGWFQDDAIHYTSDGSVMRAAMIADALAVQFPA